jgi:coenzyme F420 hydrogenase subunit beta
MAHSSRNGNECSLAKLQNNWGPILEIWEGHAVDPEIRYHGSSGGLANAIALYCLEEAGMHGVIHTGTDDEIPWKNKTVLSQNPSELLKRTGSRYSPSSPCEGLDQIEKAEGSCAFIGKPCDIAGLRKAQLLRPDLNKNLGIAIGIFCAGTPSTTGTLDLLKKINVNTKEIEGLRYRGKGWPGKFTVQLKGEKTPSHQMSYMDAWGFLQKYRPFRCYLCPDGTGEFADISCGDPWHRKPEEGEPGYSLVLVRTEKGREVLRGAMKEGYVVLECKDSQILEKSQRNLLAKRGAIWGRLITMKAFGIPTPRLKGFYLFKIWCQLSTKEKARSVLGTARRIIERKYYKPLKSM